MAKSTNVLWLSDSHSLNYYSNSLSSHGWNLVPCHSTQQALELLQKGSYTHIVQNILRKDPDGTQEVNMVKKFLDLMEKAGVKVSVILATVEFTEYYRMHINSTDTNLRTNAQLYFSRLPQLEASFSSAKIGTLTHSMPELLQLISDNFWSGKESNLIIVPNEKKEEPSAPPSEHIEQNKKEEVVSVINSKGQPYFFKTYIAQGNFGLVYTCQDYFGQEYILKTLKTNRPKDQVESDWKKETEMLFALSHPNIIKIYDAFIHLDYYYLIMEKADGDLRGYVTKRGKLDNNQVVTIAGQILSALNHIHSKDIIHRDLHMDNLLYSNSDTDGNSIQVKISDFGISKRLMQGQNLAATIIGRDYDYAPELVTYRSTNKQSDLYQLGLILYFCYTGLPALTTADGGAGQAAVSGIARKRAQDLKSPLGNVISNLLHVEPGRRYNNCNEVWFALNKCKISVN